MQQHQYGVDGGEEQGEEGVEAAGGMLVDDAPCTSSGGGTGSSSRLTEEQLLQRVQCSAAELRAGLEARRALCIGAWVAVEE